MRNFSRMLLMLVIFINGLTILCTGVLYLLATITGASVVNIWTAGFKAAIIVMFGIMVFRYVVTNTK